MATKTGSDPSYLICHWGEMACALPLDQVVEILRPLPILDLPRAPAFVLGACRLRGSAVPVVDGGKLLGVPGENPIRRFVSLRVGDRAVVLAAGGVRGVLELPAATFAALPPLLRDAGREACEALGVLDGELLFLLSGARLLPPETPGAP